MANRFLTDVVLTSTPASDVVQKCIMNTWNLDHSFFLKLMLVISRGSYKVSIFVSVATVQSHLNVPDCKVFNFCDVGCTHRTYMTYFLVSWRL